MNTIRAIFIFLFLTFLGLFVFNSTVFAASTVTVTSPNGGECIEVGKNFTVTWTSNEIDHVAFYFVKNAKATSTLPTYGSWTVHPVSGNSWSWSPISSDVTEKGMIWIEGHNTSHTRIAIDGSNAMFAVRANCSLDTTKPASITTLRVKSVVGTSVTLEWNATGDDGNTGTATSYDLRYSTSAITTSNWSTRTQAQGEPSPASPGTVQSFTVTGLNQETKYFFAIRALDEAGNISDLDATSVTATTGVDVTPPVITNIKVENITATSADISWDTNEPATSEVSYGKTTSYEEPKITKTTLVTKHSVKLSGLSAQTLYHVKVSSKDAKNNISNSSDNTFTTLPSIITLSFTANKASVAAGQEVTLSWNTLPVAASCTASGAWSGTKAASGSEKVAVNASSEYKMTCSLTGLPSVTRSLTVDVISTSAFNDGDLIRVSSLSGEEGKNIWIIKVSPDRKKRYRRLILSADIFNQYGHLKWSNVKEVSQEMRDIFAVSNYVRAYDPNPSSFVDDPKVYRLIPNEFGDNGIKQHMDMSAQAFYAKVDAFSVFTINKFERDSYTTGAPITSL